MIRHVLRLALALLPVPALGFTLEPPASALLSAQSLQPGPVDLAAGVHAQGVVPTRQYPGAVLRRVWRIPGHTSTSDLAVAFKGQLQDAGYTIVFDCAARACGGFDFRFAIEVLPEPEMHVDLGDFRYVLAERITDAGTEAVSLVISRSRIEGYVQVTTVAPGDEAAMAPDPAPRTDRVPVAGTDSIVGLLEHDGHAVLEDLTFQTGSSTLGNGRFPSLEALANYLRSQPGRTVVIVGHTDAVGSLEANIALSRRRAASVVDRLVTELGVPSRQVSGEGVGFLAPRATNLTAEGRGLNRRVEVVLTSTE